MSEQSVESVHNYLLQKTDELEIHEYPFSHTFTDDFFPVNFYKQLNKYFPDYYDPGFHNLMKPNRFIKSVFTAETKTTNPDALKTYNTLSQVFTRQLAEKFLKKFDCDYTGELAWMCDYCWDLPGDRKSLEPHTDHPSKLISMIVYLPLVEIPLRIINKQIQYFPIPGTDLLIQNSDKNFSKVREIKAWCNRFVAFKKSTTSWHGVEETQHPRRTITMFIIDPSYFKENSQKSFIFKTI